MGLLTALAEADQPIGASELARRAGLPTSSTYRLVQGLERHGLVARPQRGGITLGLRILELAQRVDERLEQTLLEAALPMMRRLASRHRETVLLTAPVAEFAIGLGAVDSPRPLRLTYARWRLAPLHRGASGKVLLAFLAASARDAIIERAAERDPGLDRDGLRRDLELARTLGHVVTHGELDEGASGVAAPIVDRRDQLVAGLTIAGPSERIRGAEAELTRAVMEAAQEVGAALLER